MLVKEVDLAVIGAGPAGMAAAIKAREAGLDRVILFERAECLGGLLHQCIHNGFGLHRFGEDMTGPEYAYRFIGQISSMDVEICLNTMVTHLGPDRAIVAINSRWGEFTVNAKAIILAMGCRERSRFSIGIPGSRPAGILTAGLAQRLVNVDGYLPGRQFVILGSGDIGMIMARRLRLEGAEVKAVVEILPHVGGLIRNEVQCLHDFNIPLLLEHTVTDIYGNYRVEGVKIARVQDGKILKDTERDISCDCLLLSVGLIPENELSREAGIIISDETGGPMVDEYLQTNVRGIFASGNVLQVHDLVDNVSLEGEKAASNAVRFINGEIKEAAKEISVVAGKNIKSVVPQRITGREDVELSLRVKDPVENAVLKAGEYRKKFRVLTPTEIIKLKLKPSDFGSCHGTGKLEVSCVEGVVRK